MKPPKRTPQVGTQSRGNLPLNLPGPCGTERGREEPLPFLPPSGCLLGRFPFSESSTASWQAGPGTKERAEEGEAGQVAWKCWRVPAVGGRSASGIRQHPGKTHSCLPQPRPVLEAGKPFLPLHGFFEHRSPVPFPALQKAQKTKPRFPPPPSCPRCCCCSELDL